MGSGKLEPRSRRRSPGEKELVSAEEEWAWDWVLKSVSPSGRESPLDLESSSVWAWASGPHRLHPEPELESERSSVPRS